MIFRYITVEFPPGHDDDEVPPPPTDWAVSGWGVNAPIDPSETYFNSSEPILNRVWCGKRKRRWFLRWYSLVHFYNIATIMYQDRLGTDIRKGVPAGGSLRICCIRECLIPTLIATRGKDDPTRLTG